MSEEKKQLEEMLTAIRKQEKQLAELYAQSHTTPYLFKKINSLQKKLYVLHQNMLYQLKFYNRSSYSPKVSQITAQLLQEGKELSEQISTFIQDHSVQLQQVNGEVEEPRIPVLPASASSRVPAGGHALPPLPYPYNALEPYIDEKTMRLHHDCHHQGYVDGLNRAEREMQKARESGDFSLILHWEREAAFHGAGHYLHTIFWNNMSPSGGGEPDGAIGREIERTFGGFDRFKAHFSASAEKVEGVGWAMLVWSPRAQRTEILQAEKHQNLSQQDAIPLLVLDVWEHAYYLKYQNKRGEYVKQWWNVVNWQDVNQRYLEARKLRWQPY